MSTTGNRGLIRTIALAATAAAIAGAAAVAVTAGAASAHSTPATHHALADGGIINSD
jgi:hypothetical protein